MNYRKTGLLSKSSNESMKTRLLGGNLMNILIAEDERDLLELLHDNISREGHTVFVADNGREAWEIFEKEPIDLCILDVMMPEIDGLELIQNIRKASEVPVIFLTARGDDTDKVLGLTLGADDYLVKPFSMSELKARIQVQVRHLQKNKREDNSPLQQSVLKCGELSLHLNEAVCYKNNQVINLLAKEYLLLKMFMENTGHVYTKKQLYNAVWQEEYYYDDNTVMVHLSH